MAVELEISIKTFFLFKMATLPKYKEKPLWQIKKKIK